MNWQHVPHTWSSSRKTPVTETYLIVGRRTSVVMLVAVLSPSLPMEANAFVRCMCLAGTSTCGRYRYVIMNWHVPLTVPLHVGASGPHLIRGFLDPHLESAPKRHLDWFSHFCTAHLCTQHTDTQTTLRAASVAVGCSACTACR